MIRIRELRLLPGYRQDDIKKAAAEALGIAPDKITRCRLYKRSLDARKKNDIHYVCTVEAELPDEEKYLSNSKVTAAEPYVYSQKRASGGTRPIIVGAGPAGLMAGLVLARAGLRPIILERGQPVEYRARAVGEFWKSGQLDTESNVQFGEGGAGTFSDGKLTTGISDPRCRFILEEFVGAGAPEEILFDAKPHIGTDRLRDVVKNLRNEILAGGGEVLFGCKLTGLLINGERLVGVSAVQDGKTLELPAEFVILAIGHSARDTFAMLHEAGLVMVQKAFSAGVRIEHLQSAVDLAQYGRKREKGDRLLPADYKLSLRLKSGRGVYTFCMCPGGSVVAAASEAGRLATNGMSLYARNSLNANSALLVGVTPEDFESDFPLAGVEFQRRLEAAAFAAGGGGYIAPAQTVGDFLRGKETTAFGKVIPSYRPGVVGADMRSVLPGYISEALREAIPLLGNQMRGFNAPEAVLTGTETRSSSPVRILRDENLEANIKGVIPCGEGSGYAGGIMSAAVDGVRCAERILMSREK